MPEFDVLDFHARAVRTPSHESVDEMRDLLCETLRKHDQSLRVDDAGNVIATRGNGNPHVVLNTHIDTVAPHVECSRDGDVVRGRGACDAKGPLAALLAAFLAVEPDAGRVTLAVTPDEETDSAGAHTLELDADCYVVGEPTDLAVCTSARGRFQGTVELTGEGAHAAEPETGRNAVAAAEQALAAVRSYDDGHGHGPDEHPELGPATLTPTTVRGGDATNRVPDDCEIVVDRRTVPPETQAGFFETFEGHVRAAVSTDIGVTVSPAERETPFLEAFDSPDGAPVVEALVESGAANPRPFGAATEASYFAADAPTVVFGPGVLADDEGPVAHAHQEYVRRSAVERAATIITDALRSLL